MTEWRDIPSWPGYQVSDDGQVTCNGKPRKRSQSGRYYVVHLGGRKGRQEYVHRLVLLAFVGPPPEDKPCALHWNDNGFDNRLENLRWGDNLDNVSDANRNGRLIYRQRTSRPLRKPNPFVCWLPIAPQSRKKQT